MTCTDDPRLVIVGAGGHACVVADALLPRRVVGHLRPSDSAIDRPDLLGPWLGDDDMVPALADEGHSFVIGLGFVDDSGALHRARLLSDLVGTSLEIVVHSSAIVASTVVVGEGVFVAAGAVVGAGARLGRGTIVNSGAVVDHDCQLDSNVHVASGATLAGSVSVGSDSLIGLGASVRQGVSIGTGAVVGAGAVVVGDVPDGTTVVGVPARRILQRGRQ